MLLEWVRESRRFQPDEQYLIDLSSAQWEVLEEDLHATRPQSLAAPAQALPSRDSQPYLLAHWMPRWSGIAKSASRYPRASGPKLGEASEIPWQNPLGQNSRALRKAWRMSLSVSG